ncbi:FIST C-terminal domain-containing protein [Roseomonas sp. NAR14]|uniref:FIST C-terminal domain-containing protein n=1 Tax=Roseomonas acroporae TaxID=2937791 RepID=A0A9X1Y8Y4_9PROT|nr:FIST N-terminal domain-containing protein [Roseomonas acroporae]MCK8784490.1 FIST C-terminal domain-containing protein [Roseomonas acroporae]
MLLVFCGGKLDPALVLTAFRDRFGDVPVVGGAAAGAITRSGYGYSGLEIGLLAFGADDPVPEVLIAELLPGEEEAGRRLGQGIRDVAAEDAAVLLLFDSVAVQSPLRLHPASEIVRGVHQGLAGHRVHLLGGGLLTNMNLGDGWVFDGREVRKHLALALVFPPRVEAETVILHGCRPVSTFMRITRIEGSEVFELDGEPALDVIERMLGVSLGAPGGQDLSLIATLGQKQGDPYAPYDENDYVNRLILKANPRTGSVTLFEPDFTPGAMVQIMGRDNLLMLESVRDGMQALGAAIRRRSPLFGLYIDCAGRASARSGSPTEEAELVLRGLPPDLPFLGFYSGVEVAPFGGQARPLDWTGVLTVLCER